MPRKTNTDSANDSTQKESFATETMLELTESEDGRLLLRDMEGKESPLVSIEFSDKVKDMLGEDTRTIGQHMIHAAIQVIMHKQMNQWHAHVYDEEPENYS